MENFNGLLSESGSKIAKSATLGLVRSQAYPWNFFC
jgi:hypothetical protein